MLAGALVLLCLISWRSFPSQETWNLYARESRGASGDYIFKVVLINTLRYQIHTGLQHSIIRPTQPNCLPLDNATLPQKLKEVGYSTHMVGKWHLGFYRKECMPTKRGFDTFFGSLLGSGDYYTHYKCDSPGMCGYDLYENDNAAWDYDNGIYSTQMYTQRVQQILASHDSRKPIFLYIAYQAVHSPLQAPGRYFEHYRSIININRRRYAAMLSCLDEAINNVTLALKTYGFYNNSIIIYSSDNGGQPTAGGSNWPLRGSKGTYWEGGIRAVGFVHSPLLKNKGTVCKELVHITDWYPTLISLAEGQIDEDIQLDGYDVWETISEGLRSPRVDILHNIDPIYTKAKNGSWAAGYGIWNTAIQSAIRVQHWKLLTGNPGYSDWVPPQSFSNLGPNRWHNERITLSTGKSVWLFNITADPYERVDLSHRYPGIVKQLLRRLSQFNKTAVPVRYPPKDPRSNPRLNGGVWGPWYKEEYKKKKPSKKKAEKKQKKSKTKKKQQKAGSFPNCHSGVCHYHG
ncbi:arylsulfatase J isoform X2 [Lutra lutra]|uniref:arylsulfatase J isoform X2 n=1 Tax=Lutra lutra TaxID=9657 RepID=UPI001FD096E7|nr:arylsulfatase J isoform X2 [Lutra lutra]